MDELIAFITARLDEDAAAAKAVYGRWDEDAEGNLVDHSYGAYLATGPYGGGIDDATRAHILRHDPARVLREVEADRKLLTELDEARKFSDHMFSSSSPEGVTPGKVPGERMRAATQVTTRSRVIAIRATRFSDHPDYRQEWAP